MKVLVKNMPRLRLADLLRRRKMSLKQMLDEFGITTYEGLTIRCNRMGVTPPDESDFHAVFPPPMVKPVNNPMEGIIVVEAMSVIDDITGREIDPDGPVMPGIEVVTDHPSQQQDDPGPHQKKQRRKKETNQNK